jgi:hypothetical protein
LLSSSKRSAARILARGEARSIMKRLELGRIWKPRMPLDAVNADACVPPALSRPDRTIARIRAGLSGTGVYRVQAAGKRSYRSRARQRDRGRERGRDARLGPVAHRVLPTHALGRREHCFARRAMGVWPGSGRKQRLTLSGDTSGDIGAAQQLRYAVPSLLVAARNSLARAARQRCRRSTLKSAPQRRVRSRLRRGARVPRPPGSLSRRHRCSRHRCCLNR